MFGREGSAKDRASEENEEKVEDEEAGPASCDCGGADCVFGFGGAGGGG
jgi:hypothetical protein